jgi:hypothetical protein
MSSTAQLSDAKRSLLAKYAAGKARSATSQSSRIVRRGNRAIAPLSLSQEELWRREQRVPEISPLYNECVTIQMKGALDVAALEGALAGIIRRHESWRTTFETRAGQPVQISHEPEPVRFPIIDVRDFPEAVRGQEAIRLVNAETARPFDLQRQPPLRPVLVRIDDAEHRLFLIAHQIVLDGVSAYQFFPSELAEFYKASLQGRPPRMPELAIQCSDFAHWQRESIDRVRNKQLDYWRTQLATSPAVPNWPAYGARHASRTYHGVIRPFVLSPEISHKLKALSHRQNSTLFSTLVAGFASLLRRYTGQDDVVVGTLSPCGRKRTETQGLLGYFLNPVALRLDFAHDPSFPELIHQAQRVMTEAICHDDVPIEAVAQELGRANFSPSPFFRAALSLQPSTPNLGLEDLGLNWSVTSMDVDSGGSPWELYLAFIDRPAGIMGRIQFDPELFDGATIEQLLQDLSRLFETECSGEPR